MTPLQTALDEIKKRLEAATPGPWTLSASKQFVSKKGKLIAETYPGEAELIAAAPTDIAKLLEVVKLYDETLGLVDGRYRYRDVNDEDCEGDYCLEARAKAAKILGEGERRKLNAKNERF